MCLLGFYGKKVQFRSKLDKLPVISPEPEVISTWDLDLSTPWPKLYKVRFIHKLRHKLKGGRNLWKISTWSHSTRLSTSINNIPHVSQEIFFVFELKAILKSKKLKSFFLGYGVSRGNNPLVTLDIPILLFDEEHDRVGKVHLIQKSPPYRNDFLWLPASRVEGVPVSSPRMSHKPPSVT